MMRALADNAHIPEAPAHAVTQRNGTRHRGGLADTDRVTEVVGLTPSGNPDGYTAWVFS